MASEKKARMTDRERIEAMLKRKKPDRVPVWPIGYPGFAVVNAGYTIAEAYNNPEKAFKAERWCCEQYGWVFTPLFFYASYGGWEFGGEIKWPSSKFDQAPIITRYPVEAEEDIWNLTGPDVKKAGFIPLLTEFNKLSLQERLNNEPFYVMVPIGSSFTIAGNICGPEKLCKWLLKKPEVAHRLLRLATDHSLDLFQYWKKNFGTEGLLAFTGEPTASNQLISSKQFEKFVFPYLKELFEKILALGYKHIYCHICGEQNTNLPFWAQLPMGDPGIVSIGHEIDLLKAAEHFPNDIILGNLEPGIIQTGTPEEVYEASKAVIEKGKKCSGGFAFSPGCELPPMAPPLNVWMMTKAANEFGWYE